MVDISEIAKEAGLTYRTLVTPEVWETFGEGGQIPGRDLRKRFFMMLDTLQIALTRRRGPRGKNIYFSTRLGERGDTVDRVVLKATIDHEAGAETITIQPGDGGEVSGKNE